MRKNVFAIIDGQAGSCGKGKVIGQFAIENNVDVAIANTMPNAGHTFCANGIKRVFRHIPVSSINPNTKLFIGAGSIIDMNVLEQEFETNKDILDGREIIVHPMVPIIEDRHIQEEKKRLRSGSTFKGGGACLSEKIMRDPKIKFFDSYKGIKSDSNYHQKLMQFLNESKRILLEGSQGCDLDINHSGHFPHVTSRPVSVAQMLSDSGISPMRLKEVIMVIRPFPIRISNSTNIGKKIYSGDYGNSQELTWDQINVGAFLGQYPKVIDENDIDSYADMIDTDFTEYTTVTKKERRIFDIDIVQLKKNIEINTPTNLYLNFFQHLGVQYQYLSGKYDDIYLEKYQEEYLCWLEKELGIPITILGTGPDIKHYVKVMHR